MYKLVRLLLPLLALTLVIALATSTALGDDPGLVEQSSTDQTTTCPCPPSPECPVVIAEPTAQLFSNPSYDSSELPPPLPCRFRGQVTFLNSEPAPPGTLVTFTIAGDTYTTTTPAEKDYGISWYWIQIVPPAGTNYTGQPAYIEVNGLPVHVATWEVGGNQVIHLSVPISAGASSQGMANPAAVTSNVALPGWSDDPPPALPSRFRGLVTVNGQPAPDGTTVTIEVGGEIYQTTTPSIYGPSTYFNQVVPPEGEDFIGDIVYFAVNGVPVKAVTWEPGGNTQVDLQT